MKEIDYLMRVDAGGVITFEDDPEAKQARLDEWFGTPEGSIYGIPSWGNPIGEYKHEPTSQDYLAVLIESHLISKIRTDLPEVDLQGINCYPANGLPQYDGKGGFVVEVLTPDFTYKTPLTSKTNG